MGIALEEIDFERVRAQFQELSFGEQLDVIPDLLLVMMRNVTAVAREYSELQENRIEQGEALKVLEKAIDYGLSRRGLIKNILKRKGSMLDKEFFTKERDKVREITKTTVKCGRGKGRIGTGEYFEKR